MLAQADLDIGCPTMMVRLPMHPALKYLPGSWHIVQHFLHMDVLVPQLINTWQKSNSSVPHIPGMIDEPCTHLHLGILQPKSDACIADLQSSLPD